MEAYFPIVKKQTRQKTRVKQASELSIATGIRLNSSGLNEVLVARDSGSNSREISMQDITDRLLTALSDSTNPITHSDIANRTEHYVAFTTGHQVAEERVNRKLNIAHRLGKLHEQKDSLKSHDGSTIFNNVSIYLDGYLEATTDIEMKRLVMEGGGQIVPIESQCTHIVTSRCLSASKTQRFLSRKKSKIHVVKPEWIFDSLTAGKRRPERAYAIVKHAKTLEDFLNA